MDLNQGEFNFDAASNDAGWKQWREQLDQRKRAFEQRWGIILGKRIILTLRDYAHPFQGIITIVQEPKKSSPTPEPLFRVGHVTFRIDEIISLTAAD